MSEAYRDPEWHIWRRKWNPLYQESSFSKLVNSYPTIYERRMKVNQLLDNWDFESAERTERILLRDLELMKADFKIRIDELLNKWDIEWAEDEESSFIDFLNNNSWEKCNADHENNPYSDEN